MSITNFNVKQGSSYYDIFDWYTIYGAKVSGSAVTSPVNNRLCIKVMGTTTILFPFNKIINFVAVGGGQSGFAGTQGGRGGGVVYGTFSSSDLLTINIGAGGGSSSGSSGGNTTIAGTNITITANGGPNSGSVLGSNVYTSTAALGGAGGTGFGQLGFAGTFISNLGIYSGGGGGSGDISGASSTPGGVAGGGTGANLSGPGGAGTPNTGGGGGGGSGSSVGIGGSGVVYLYV
jgi:hypothetical protein